MGDLLWYLIIGGIAGWIGSILFKGTGSGVIINIVLGILGGALGGWLLGNMGIGGRIGPFFTAIIGAFLLNWIFSLFRKSA